MAYRALYAAKHEQVQPSCYAVQRTLAGSEDKQHGTALADAEWVSTIPAAVAAIGAPARFLLNSVKEGSIKPPSLLTCHRLGAYPVLVLPNWFVIIVISEHEVLTLLTGLQQISAQQTLLRGLEAWLSGIEATTVIIGGNKL